MITIYMTNKQGENKSLLHFDYCIAERPEIPTPEERIEYIEVPGRDGTLTVKNGYNDIEVSMDLNYLGDNSKISYRHLKNWLKDVVSFYFSDDDTIFYKVKSVKFQTAQNEIVDYIYTTVNFVCDPFQYTKAGDRLIKFDRPIFIDGLPTKPYLKITTNKANIKFKINDTVVKFEELPQTPMTVEMDCEAYTLKSGFTNLLPKMPTLEFPTLKQGVNTLSELDGVLKVEIKTRERFI